MPGSVRDAIANAFAIVYLACRDITDFQPDMSVNPSGKLLVEIPADIVDAGGLACHADAGISIGHPLSLTMVQR